VALSRRNGDVSHAGPSVEVSARFAGSERTWTGTIVRTEGEIDPKSRMVHVIARVENPYGGEGPDGVPLPVGLFVKAEILGREARDVAVLPRSALRGGDRVLVVDRDDRLRFRDVGVLRKARDTVVVQSGLASGEFVVTSPIETPVEGMQVRPVIGDENETRAEVTAGAGA
jgi:multidrug efflux pump subunit AcrA (membrane-fusion protein)